MIFVHHFGLQGSIVESFGDIVVCVFFVLSGFVMSASYEGRPLSLNRRSMSRFMFNRVLRVYPLYLFALLAITFVLMKPISWKILVVNALMLQVWFPISDVFFSGNSPAWFVSAIMFSYVIFLPVLWLLRHRRRMFFRLFVCALVLYAVGIVVIPSDQVFYLVYICPVSRALGFILGMVEWDYVYRHRNSSGLKSCAPIMCWTALAFAVVQILCYEYVTPRLTLCSYWWPLVVVMIGAFTLADSENCLITRIFHWKPLVKMGDFSFTFYILHLPWIYFTQLVVAWCNIDVNIWLLLTVSIAALQFVAYWVNRFVEEPLYRRFKSAQVSLA